MISRATSLKRILEIGSPCNKCGHCCKFNSGLVTEQDIDAISESLNMDRDVFIQAYLEEIEMFHTKIFRFKINKEDDKPYGKCVFFSGSEGCKIHSVKPIFCQTSNCFAYSQDLIAWFYLNYLVNPDDPQSIRDYASYLESEGKLIPGGHLHEIVLDSERLRKILNYEELL